MARGGVRGQSPHIPLIKLDRAQPQEFKIFFLIIRYRIHVFQNSADVRMQIVAQLSAMIRLRSFVLKTMW
jgi:hypothetical protein